MFTHVLRMGSVIAWIVMALLGALAPVAAQGDGETLEPIFEVQIGSGDSFALFESAWNADESRILVCGSDVSAYVYDAATGEELLVLRHILNPNPEAFLNWVAAYWSPDGK